MAKYFIIKQIRPRIFIWQIKFLFDSKPVENSKLLIMFNLYAFKLCHFGISHEWFLYELVCKWVKTCSKRLTIIQFSLMWFPLSASFVWPCENLGNHIRWSKSAWETQIYRSIYSSLGSWKHLFVSKGLIVYVQLHSLYYILSKPFQSKLQTLCHE